MRSKVWLKGYFCIIIVALGLIGGMVYDMDPYFHYRYPQTERYYYQITNERYQNDGIVKNFEYNAIITGTSMTQEFKTSEMDALFGTKAIKVPYSGGSYKEVNNNLRTALKYQPELQLIIRGLDMNRFMGDGEYDLESYPLYLYNENPFDDVKYLFNRNVALDICYNLIESSRGMEPGIMSFDDYGVWGVNYSRGINTVCPDGIHMNDPKQMKEPVSDEEKRIIQENIYENVTSLVEEYPDVTFYYFFPPYSVLWWEKQKEAGMLERQFEAEKYVIELLLEYDNIRLYSFNNRTDITTDLNHYKDTIHYASWINSLMLRWMHDGEYLLTRENYLDYLEQERAFYTEFDYESLNGQEDYECDDYAAALLRQELCGVKPLELTALFAEATNEDTRVNGLSVFIQDIDEYKFLVFYGRNTEDEQVSVQIFDEQGKVVSELTAEDGPYLDHEWHQYVLNISDIKGDVTICFSGGTVSGESVTDGEVNSDIELRDIYLY